MACVDAALCRSLGKHCNGGVVASPSTQEWAIRRPLYSPEGLRARKTLSWIMVKCCLEAQMKFVYIFRSPLDSWRRYREKLLRSLLEGVDTEKHHWISSGVGVFLEDALVRDTLCFNHRLFVNERSNWMIKWTFLPLRCLKMKFWWVNNINSRLMFDYILFFFCFSLSWNKEDKSFEENQSKPPTFCV